MHQYQALPIAAATAGTATLPEATSCLPSPETNDQAPPAAHPDPDHQGTSPWRPYECAWTETPVPLFRSLPNAYFRFRWMALWPLHACAGRLPFLGPCSVGELLAAGAMAAGAATWAAGTYGREASGHVAEAFLVGALVLSTRNSLATFLLGLSHERAVWWHGMAALLATAAALGHGLGMALGGGEGPAGGEGGHGHGHGGSEAGARAGVEAEGGEGHGGERRVSMSGEGGEAEEHMGGELAMYVTGWLGFGLMAALVLTSAFRGTLRAYAFSVWQALHWLLLLCCLVAVALHSPAWVLAGAACWAADLAARWGLQAGTAGGGRQVELAALPADVVRVSWPAEGFSYAGGQYVYINIPGVHWAEFHPFSLSSAPGSDQVHVHVRVLGDWTRALHALATQDATPGQPKRVRAFIEGPFGTPSIDLHGDSYKAFLLVSGGIGVTPLQSVFNHLMAQRARGRPVRVARLVWAVRDRAMVSAVQGYDAEYASRALPQALPLSFQPDLISPNTYRGGCTAAHPRSTHPPHSASAPAPAPHDVELAAVPLSSPAGDWPQSAGEGGEGAAEEGEGEGEGDGETDRELIPAGARRQQQPLEDFISTEFYLTQARPSQQFPKANILPGRQPCVALGRPDLAALLRDTGRRAAERGETRVAVMVCGPRSMVQEVQAAAAQHSGRGEGRVAFDVHAETFEL